MLCSAALALAGIAGAATARFAPESTSPPPTGFLTPTETAVTPADLARERRQGAAQQASNALRAPTSPARLDAALGELETVSMTSIGAVATESRTLARSMPRRGARGGS